MKHHYELTVYHADTDCYGIVWHGNYLKFCEQARCNFVASVSKGMKYFEENGILTPLIEANVKYKNPAKVHDVLDIETSIEKLTPLRATIRQIIFNKTINKETADITVTFVCTDKNGNLMRKMPDEMFKMLEQNMN